MQPVKVEIEDGIAKAILNIPESFNALDIEMADALAKALSGFSTDESVKTVIISGEGKAFCAGGNLKWALKHPSGTRAAFRQLAGRFHQSIIEIRRIQKPVIAAVNGVAAGAGFSLALACDFRVMEKSAALRQAYTSVGLCIDGGGSYTLPRLVGQARATEIIAFDEPISSERALDWGMVTKVVEDGMAMDESVKMARELCGRSIYSFGWCKSLITDSFDTPLEVQLERERAGIADCGATEEGIERMRAFAEKRKPVLRN
jgi:2-(1,2-epoxy-1,2-dihydrophenyl)acetyl-CoA isomerase